MFFRRRSGADPKPAAKTMSEPAGATRVEASPATGSGRARDDDGAARSARPDVDRLRLRWKRERTARRETAERLRRLEDRFASRERSLEFARGQSARLRANVLSWEVVRQSLPLRLVSAHARAALPETRDRERRFLAASAAYDHAQAGVVSPAVSPGDEPAIARTTVQGLSWSVPVMREGDERPDSPWMRKQKFPYRAIVLTRELSLGGVMLDLGANTGRMSIPRAILGDATAVYCAEPDSVNYACLVRNVVDNGLRGLVMPDHVAIGSYDGEATLQRSRFSGGHRLVDDPGQAPSDVVTVPMRTLDVWLAGLGVDPDLVTFVKMDVQGWEAHVFAGAAGLLARRHVAWQVEISPLLLGRAGTSLPAFYAMLRTHFNRFTDLNKEHPSPRGRSTSELEQALSYLTESSREETDLLLFNA
ncbi:MAG: FkbM family methyltransferase [Vicinamibacterales bacterium]